MARQAGRLLVTVVRREDETQAYRVVEDLVDVGVKNHAFPARVAHEAVPVASRLEGIGDDENSVAGARRAVWPPYIPVAVMPELLDHVHHL